MERFRACFAELDDPRTGAHSPALDEVVMIAPLATLCGAETCVDLRGRTETLARLRRFALNVLRAHRDQGSTRGKFKRARWDGAFLLKLLTTA